MSLSGRRPVLPVGSTQRIRTFHYYYCRLCRRTVRIPSRNLQAILCPFCYGGLRDEPRPVAADSRAQQGFHFVTRFLNDMARALDPPDVWRDSLMSRRAVWGVEREDDGMSLNSWITLQFEGLPRLPDPVPQSEAVPHSHGADHSNDMSNYDTHADPLNEFFGDSAQNDQPGPPPAHNLAIETLPTITISESQLKDDPHCPVCKEEFGIGGEARELPCRHFYHSDCITPWLQIHNTCPVCRFELKNSTDDDFEAEGVWQFGNEDTMGSLNQWWSQLLSSRPFDAFFSWVYRNFSFLQNRRTASRSGTSRWRSWFIL